MKLSNFLESAKAFPVPVARKLRMVSFQIGEYLIAITYLNRYISTGILLVLYFYLNSRLCSNCLQSWRGRQSFVIRGVHYEISSYSHPSTIAGLEEAHHRLRLEFTR